VQFPVDKRWILGTAQWAKGYGVMPSPKAADAKAAQDLADEAQRLGVSALDTAPAYGEAETTISHLRTTLHIQTKVRGGIGSIADQVKGSLDRCGVERLDSVLVHDWRSLTSRQRVITARALETLEDDGVVGRSGPSCYHPEELDEALSIFRALRVAQVPVNLLDQRLEANGLAQRAAEAGCRVQARSVFLQGLLIGARELPGMWSHQDLARLLAHGFEDHALAMRLCLTYVLSRPWVCEIVLGAHDKGQLREICRLARCAADDATVLAWEDFASDDLNLIDPTRW